jgi:glutaredoxin
VPIFRKKPAEGAPVIDFYWRPGCPFCMALEHGLGRAGIGLNKVNIWKDPEAAARVRQITGGDETVPTVVIGERGLVNPSVGEVLAELNG